MTVKVFFDTNILYAYLRDRDPFIERIIKASKNEIIESYTSIHAITELVNVLNKDQLSKTLIDKFNKLIIENNINVIYDYTSSIISSSIHVIRDGISYEDLINLKIAEEKNIEYFITNDIDLIRKKKYYNNVIITTSTDFSQLLVGGMF